MVRVIYNGGPRYEKEKAKIDLQIKKLYEKKVVAT